VQAYFWQFTCPDVKFSLVGVNETTKYDETSFERFKQVKNDSTIKLDPSFTLALLSRWVNTNEIFKDADVVYLLTGDSIRDFMGAYKLEMKAASYFFGPCSDRRAALSEDDGRTFSGVPAMVQQIAHIFGIKWDDSRSPKSQCRADDGYIMTKNGEPTKLANFSSCSHQTWEDEFLLHAQGTKCFNRTPIVMSSENEKLPADFYKGCDYCKIFFSEHKGAKQCDNISEVSQSPLDMDASVANATCKVVCCVNDKVHVVNSPDGTKCDSEKVILTETVLRCINRP
ncbi:unnamed protein product, partial [Ixodes hexagonus]